MDFLDRLINYIEKQVVMNAIMKIGRLDQNSSAASIRQTPSGISGRFFDGGKTSEFSFQVLVKDSNHLKVINTLQQITDELDGLSNSAIESENDSFSFIKCEVYVNPNYVEETDHGEYIYTALFTAELEGGK